MSSKRNTHRFYSNNKRLSTAVELSNGMLQVYPVKRNFASVDEWKVYWTKNTKLAKHFTINDEKPAPAPAPAPATGTLDAEQRFIARPDENPEDWTHKETFKFTAPAGEYYIGDLCYVLGDGLYDKIFGQVGDYDSGLYQKRDSLDFFFVDNTAYGDGDYVGSDGHHYYVDAGIIGITPVSCCEKDDGGGRFITFSEPVTCKFHRGVFRFQWGSDKLVIDTHGYSDEE